MLGEARGQRSNCGGIARLCSRRNSLKDHGEANERDGHVEAGHTKPVMGRLIVGLRELRPAGIPRAAKSSPVKPPYSCGLECYPMQA
jgi:hypothetical protein